MTEEAGIQGDHEETMTIPASADTIFDFVADVRNLPKYLPTTKSAQAQGKDRVQVQGEAQGHQYNADGYLRADRARNRLEWGADERYYSGFLQITPNGNNESEVTVHLSFRGTPPSAPSDEGPSHEDLHEGMRKSLESIQNYVTGQGGKEEPSAAT